MGPDPPTFRCLAFSQPFFDLLSRTVLLARQIMGVPNLWEVLKSSAEICDLKKICFDRGFDAQKKPMVLGVDISIWFSELDAVYREHHSKAGESPELRLIFYRLAQLSSHFVSPVFVFDGPLRPTVKRGIKIIPVEHWMVYKTKEMVEAFGFKFHEAPGEAEAELARMNKEGVIDAVLTEDVDALVFGASTVIQVSQFTGNCLAKVYTMENINSKLSMSRGDLVLAAILSGGDYDNGIFGCGMDTACALARSGFGTSLLTATQRQPPSKFQRFITQWRADLQHQLRTNESGHLSSKKPVLSKRVKSSFPNIFIVHLYVHPLTSWSCNSCIPPTREMFERGRLDLATLSQLCEGNFSFGTGLGLVKKFRSILSLGIAMDLLIQHFGTATEAPNRVVTTITTHRIFDELTEYKIRVDISALIPTILRGLSGSRQEVPHPDSFDMHGSVKYHWIAGDILYRAFPGMVERYHARVRIPNPFKNHAGPVTHSTRDIIDLTSDQDTDINDVIDEGDLSSNELECLVAKARVTNSQTGKKREIIDLTN